MILYTTTFPTPFGRFSAAVDDTGAVVATAFGGIDSLRQRVTAAEAVSFIPDRGQTSEVQEQVLAYARGDRGSFDLELRPVGTEFQQNVWAELRRIPIGETRCYADLALTLGTAPRAIGRANGSNPICLLIPCHRVVGKDGSLTGFAFGTVLKQRLLEHERHLASISV